VNKQLILGAIVLILVAPIIFADDAPYGDHVWTAKNILRPGWDNLLSTVSLGFADAADEDVVQGMFDYTLKGWEVNVCSQYVTGDKSYKDPNGFSGVSTDLSKIYDDAATISASKNKLNKYANETLIEVFWYVHPKTVALEYNVYLVRGSEKLYIATNRRADPAQGDTDYVADYFIINYTHAVIEYKTGQELLKASIVEKIGAS
jgi:hypothetical protein